MSRVCRLVARSDWSRLVVTPLDYHCKMSGLASIQGLAMRIHLLSSYRVMLNLGLSKLDEPESKGLVQAIKRNIIRFPEGFMFQLTWNQ